jgi:hypothetical protein
MPEPAPIEHFGDKPPPDEDTDNSEAPVFEHDKLEDFNPRDHEGWPDLDPEGGNFEHVAFPPQLDEGVS